jgi:Type II secretion system (T2SS), protein M subtype b
MRMRGSWIFGKIIALAILLVMVLPSAIAVRAGMGKFQDLQVEMSDSVDRFDKVRSIASFDVGRLSAEGGSDMLEPLFLGQEPPAILVAKLQAKLREVATQQGVEIVQASDLVPAEVQPGLQKIGTRLQVVGLYSGVLELFRQIGQSTPMLLVENVEFHSAFAEDNALQSEPPLTVMLDVWGLVPVAQSGNQP